MKRLYWLEFSGKEILMGDYTGIKETKEYEEIIDSITRLSIQEIEKKYPLQKHSVLMLIDVTGSILDNEVILAFKRNAKQIEPLTRKIGVLGIYGVRKIFFDSVLRFSNIHARSFETKEEALKWLVEEP